MRICDRCGKKTEFFIMSMFNTEEICLDCKDKEKKHPDYQRAVEADEAMIRSGNLNFGGIGLNNG
jgi:hypothetical protein